MSPINVHDDMPQMKQIAVKKTYIFTNMYKFNIDRKSYFDSFWRKYYFMRKRR